MMIRNIPLERPWLLPPTRNSHMADKAVQKGAGRLDDVEQHVLRANDIVPTKLHAAGECLGSEAKP